MNIPESVNPVMLFSGERTSGYCLRLLLDRYPDFRSQVTTCFANTGKERLETLEFVHRVETEWNVPIVWLEYDRTPANLIPVNVFPTDRRNQNLAKAAAKKEDTHWFKRVSFETASRYGEPFDKLLNWMSVLPNVVSRGCSTQLKIRTVMRYLFSKGFKEYSPIIGIRKDEEHRSIEILASCDSFEHPMFPLIEMNVRETDVMAFWRKNAFDLQLQSYEGNCDLCFLKAKWKRLKLIRENPGMVDWWLEKESAKSSNAGNGKFFRLGEPYAGLIEEIKREDMSPEFCFTTSEDIPCSCAEKGFGTSDEI